MVCNFWVEPLTIYEVVRWSVMINRGLIWYRYCQDSHELRFWNYKYIVGKFNALHFILRNVHIPITNFKLSFRWKINPYPSRAPYTHRSHLLHIHATLVPGISITREFHPVIDGNQDTWKDLLNFSLSNRISEKKENCVITFEINLSNRLKGVDSSHLAGLQKIYRLPSPFHRETTEHFVTCEILLISKPYYVKAVFVEQFVRSVSHSDLALLVHSFVFNNGFKNEREK